MATGGSEHFGAIIEGVVAAALAEDARLRYGGGAEASLQTETAAAIEATLTSDVAAWSAADAFVELGVVTALAA